MGRKSKHGHKTKEKKNKKEVGSVHHTYESVSEAEDSSDADDRMQSFMKHKLYMVKLFSPLIMDIWARGTNMSIPGDTEEAHHAYECAGKPALTFRTCGSGEGSDEIFCVWAIYEDLFSKLDNKGWVPPPTFPFPVPFRYEKHRSLGECVVANKPLLMGDLIAVERPIWMMPHHPPGITEKDLEACFEDMFYKLRSKDRDFLLKLMLKYPGLSGASPLGKKLHWVISTYGLLVTYPKSEFLPFYIGLFPVLSRCCHSCGPNAAFAFDIESMIMELRAVREINPGEKITITVCDPMMSHAKRQEVIRYKFGFQCTCEYCKVSRVDKTSDTRRKRLNIITGDISNKLWQAKDTSRLIQIHKEALDILEKEGLEQFCYEHVRWLVRVYASVGDEENMRYWASIGEQACLISGGAVEVHKIRGIWGILLSDLKQHPFWCCNKKKLCATDIGLKDFESFKPAVSTVSKERPKTYGGINLAGWYEKSESSTSKSETVTVSSSLPNEISLERVDAGMPKLMVFYCRTEDDTENNFCIWIVWRDVLEPYRGFYFWPPLSTTLDRHPYLVGPVLDIGVGLTSTKSIAPGELIVSERPLVLAPIEQAWGSEELERIIAELRPDLYAKFMELPDLQPPEHATKVQRIIESNAILVKFPQSRFLPWYQGVFPTICRCNHSCSPNAVYAFDPDTLVMELRATRPIRRGEQITFAYHDILQSYETRQKSILEKFNFRCICPQCKHHRSDRRSDELRHKILEALSTRIPSQDLDIFHQIHAFKDIILAINRENVQQYRYRFVKLLARAYAAIGDKENLKFWVNEAVTACLTSCDGIECFKEHSFWFSLLKDVSKHPDWKIHQHWARSRMGKITDS